MKQIKISFLLSAVLFLSMFNTEAQIAKGTSLVGGAVSFSTEKVESGNAASTSKESAFQFMPSYGIAINKNIVVGGDLSLGLDTKRYSDFRTGYLDEKMKSYGIGAFARHYRNLGNSGFYLFVQGRLGGSISEKKSDYHHPNPTPDRKSNSYNIRLNVYPGISYAVTQRFHIETGLTNLLWAEYTGAKTTVYENRGDEVNKSRNFSVGSSLGSTIEWSIGFRFLWGS